MGLLLATAISGTSFAQTGTSSSESISTGDGGFVLNFTALWTCDDDPKVTSSAPGEIDLISANGSVLATLTISAASGVPSISLSADGSISNTLASIHLNGANGSPADGTVHGTWNINGVPASTYTLRFWHFVRSVSGNPLTTINTVSQDAGNSHAIFLPTPTPPPVPPAVALNPTGGATAFRPVAIGFSATAGSTPLSSASLSLSLDGGQTWSQVLNDTNPPTPVCSESVSYTFATSGSAAIRATATDEDGLSSIATATMAIAKAAQGNVTITPSSASITEGQTQSFTVSGGSTGSYQWGEAASGSSSTFVAAFPTTGTYFLDAYDVGNGAYMPSSAGNSTITVLPSMYTLQLSSTNGGTVQGGGSFPSNSIATAVAIPSPGNSFSNWSGDSNSQATSIPLLMNSNKSLTAHFSALLPQFISFSAPAGITTRTPTFQIPVSASSGLPVTLTLNQGPATLLGSSVSPTGAAGNVTITASQAGNGQYLPATPVVISITINTPVAGTIISDGTATTKRSDKETPEHLYESITPN
jgi:hypothetical protein